MESVILGWRRGHRPLKNSTRFVGKGLRPLVALADILRRAPLRENPQPFTYAFLPLPHLDGAPPCASFLPKGRASTFCIGSSFLPFLSASEM